MASICPYCRTEVGAETGEAMTCVECGTPHHRECYEENGGCTLFGCRMAPPDDPKVQVTTGEVSVAAALGGASAFGTYVSPTGFGDVNAPLASATVAVSDVPPPPPPPGAEMTTHAIAPAVSEPPASSLFNVQPRQPKARLTFILLGIFLGAFGAHNFYAGYIKRGLAQLGLTVLTVFYGAFVTWIWALVEVCTVDRDSNNVSFA